jgi:Response regulator receiver domain
MPALGDTNVIEIVQRVARLHCDWRKLSTGEHEDDNDDIDENKCVERGTHHSVTKNIRSLITDSCSPDAEVQVAPLPVGLPYCGMTDSSWLQENLFCIVNNAVKYSKAAPGGVLVTVAYDTLTSTLEINVRNAASVVLTGAQLERLFEAPVLVDPNHRERGQVGGMGLGMFCLAERMKALGGECGARMSTDGKASTEVWFKIPFPPAEGTQYVTALKEETPRIGIVSELMSELDPDTSAHMAESGYQSPLPRVRTPQSVKWREAHTEKVREISHIVSGNAISGYHNGSPRMLAEPGLLPTTSAKLAHTKLPDLSSAMKPLSDVSALVVDDSIPILKVVAKAMISCGATVTTAADGAEAVSKFKEGSFDLVVTDIQMPVLGVSNCTNFLFFLILFSYFAHYNPISSHERLSNVVYRESRLRGRCAPLSVRMDTQRGDLARLSSA